MVEIDRSKLLRAATFASLGFSACLLISTFVACGQGYIDNYSYGPSSSALGPTSLWQVNKATGFVAVTSAFVSLAFAGGLAYTMLRSSDDWLLALLSNSSPLVVLMSLQTAALFGSQAEVSTEVSSFMSTYYTPCSTSLIAPPAGIVCGWTAPIPAVSYNSSARSAFDAVAAFSALNILLQGAIAALLRLEGGGAAFGGGSSSYDDIGPHNGSNMMASDGGGGGGEMAGVGGGNYQDAGSTKVSTGFEGGGSDGSTQQYRDL